MYSWRHIYCKMHLIATPVPGLSLTIFKIKCLSRALSSASSHLPRGGPDQILPSQSVKTWHPDGSVRLQLNNTTGIGAQTPMSVSTALRKTANNFPDHKGFAVKRNNVWRYWSYPEVEMESRCVAKSFIKLGLQRHRGVCIMGASSPEWSFAYFGSILAGGIAAGIYTTNSPEACGHILRDSKAQLVVVQDAEMANKFISIKHKLPSFKVIQWLGDVEDSGVLTWDNLLKIGNGEDDAELEDRLQLSAINQCCSLIYTSGTTGPPKGVMCSQDNLTWAGEMTARYNSKGQGKGSYLSFLPMNHIAGQMGLFGGLASAYTLYFADPDAMKGTLMNNLIEVQPTVFYTVPRMWEKMYEAVQLQLTKVTPLKRSVVTWAMKQGMNSSLAEIEGRKLGPVQSIKLRIADRIFLSKVKRKLGLGNAFKICSITAPSSLEVMEFFMSLGLTQTEAYGLSETMTVGTYTLPKPGAFKLGTVGKAYDEVKVKIDDVGKGDPGDGEICIHGRNVCMGYLSMEDKTHEAIDECGWLKTGDLGRLDDDGFLYITGRLKELIITAAGENISPVFIEEAIKKYLPCVSNAILVGDQRRHLSILFTMKSEVDKDTEAPLDHLLPECIENLKKIGSRAKTVKGVLDELRDDPQGCIATMLQQGITKYNNNDAVSNAQKVHKWMVLPHDFSLPTGELNNTLKLKRSFVLEKYCSLIEKMYEP